MDDRDIWTAANLCIIQHGDLAVIRAAERADALLDAGDLDGQSVWLRILDAIKTLQATTPAGPVH